jgi:hypothetical protein
MKKSKEILKAGIFVLFISLVLLSTQLSFGLPEKSEVSGGQNLANDGKEGGDVWEEYINRDFSVSFLIPGLLLKKEFKGQGGYELFVRFEENDLSRGKGVAFGVTKTSLSDEAAKLKEELTKDDQAVLVAESEVVADGVVGKLLEFEPRNLESGEKRSIFLVENSDLTYSISTAPEQIQRVVDSLDFLK